MEFESKVTILLTYDIIMIFFCCVMTFVKSVSIIYEKKVKVK